MQSPTPEGQDGSEGVCMCVREERHTRGGGALRLWLFELVLLKIHRLEHLVVDLEKNARTVNGIDVMVSSW